MPGQTISPSRPDWRLFALVFIAAAIILIVRTNFGRAGLPFFADTDDAMRMVRVRDFLAGQDWYDLTIDRLNTPFGAEIHWSRLVDLPLAVLVLALTPILGEQIALVAAGTIWPMLLLGLLLWVSARLAFRLVGPEGVLPALILPLLSPAITAEFTPGRVDHHNGIILLTVAIAWASAEAIRRPRFALLAGVLSATALAVATESLPAIAAAIAVFALAFVIEGQRAPAMRAFSLAFGLGSLVHLAIFRPPMRWFEPACDVISPLYVGVALLVAGLFTFASLVPPLRAPWQRFLLLAGPGVAGLFVLVTLYPQCLKGPYAALDSWLQANWIASIVEAKPWLSNLVEMPAYAIAIGLPVLLGLVIVAYRLLRIRQARGEWAVLLVFLAATALVMLAQVRGARLAIMLSMPVAAWLIVRARHRYLAKPRLTNIIALTGSWLAFSGVVLALAVNAVLMFIPGRVPENGNGRANTEACLVPAAFADLAALPPERIMSPIDLGAHILLYTPHAVVAAPYHRNQQGVRDAFRFLNDPIANARTILAERGIGLVVICPGMPEMGGIPGNAEDSFVSLFFRDALPDWLHDVSVPNTPLRIYSVMP